MKNTNTLLLVAMFMAVALCDLILPNYSPMWIENSLKHFSYVGLPGAALFLTFYIPWWLGLAWVYGFWLALIGVGKLGTFKKAFYEYTYQYVPMTGVPL